MVGGALVSEEHGRRLNSPFGGIVEDANIRVESNGQLTLLLFKTNLCSGVSAAEADDVLQGTLSVLVIRRRGQTLPTTELRPEDGKTESDGGDTAPGGHEATGVFFGGGTVLFGFSIGVSIDAVGLGAVAWNVFGQELEIRGARGVIRDNGLDDSVLGVALQLSPQGILVRLGPDRWAALVTGVTIADLLGG